MTLYLLTCDVYLNVKIGRVEERSSDKGLELLEFYCINEIKLIFKQF